MMLNNSNDNIISTTNFWVVKFTQLQFYQKFFFVEIFNFSFCLPLSIYIIVMIIMAMIIMPMITALMDNTYNSRLFEMELIMILILATAC